MIEVNKLISFDCVRATLLSSSPAGTHRGMVGPALQALQALITSASDTNATKKQLQLRADAAVCCLPTLLTQPSPGTSSGISAGSARATSSSNGTARNQSSSRAVLHEVVQHTRAPHHAARVVPPPKALTPANAALLDFHEVRAGVQRYLGKLWYT